MISNSVKNSTINPP